MTLLNRSPPLRGKPSLRGKPPLRGKPSLRDKPPLRGKPPLLVKATFRMGRDPLADNLASLAQTPGGG
jgi:hypothetical protein